VTFEPHSWGFRTLRSSGWSANPRCARSRSLTATRRRMIGGRRGLRRLSGRRLKWQLHVRISPTALSKVTVSFRCPVDNGGVDVNPWLLLIACLLASCGSRPGESPDATSDHARDSSVSEPSSGGEGADRAATPADATAPSDTPPQVEAGADRAATPADAIASSDTPPHVEAGDGFASRFAVEARAAIAASAPSWTCGSVLPAVPVADYQEAQTATRQLIAQVVGVPAADIAMTVNECATPTTVSCAQRFAHDLGKSGGSLMNGLLASAQDLEMNATSVQEIIWVPRQGDLTLPGNVSLSGIAGGVLVGMVVFNAPYDCP